MDEIQLLRAHMEDLVQKAQKTGVAHSHFLSQSEAVDVAASYQTRKDVVFLLDGGFAGAERRLAVFCQPDWGVYHQAEALTALALRYRRQDEVRHKDVLGAVLGLGIARGALGDICVEPGVAYLVCLAGMAPFIQQQLDRVGRIGVTVEAVPIASLPDLEPQLLEKSLTVASLRLDAVVAAAFQLSRSQAGQAIQAGRVQLAHRECQNPSQPVQPGEIVSLRGKGRVKLVAVNEPSRKGRPRIVLGYYS